MSPESRANVGLAVALTVFAVAVGVSAGVLAAAWFGG
jgi:hypothetical protein